LQTGQGLVITYVMMPPFGAYDVLARLPPIEHEHGSPSLSELNRHVRTLEEDAHV
jgi:hypothetical protein